MFPSPSDSERVSHRHVVLIVVSAVIRLKRLETKKKRKESNTHIHACIQKRNWDLLSSLRRPGVPFQSVVVMGTAKSASQRGRAVEQRNVCGVSVSPRKDDDDFTSAVSLVKTPVDIYTYGVYLARNHQRGKKRKIRKKRRQKKSPCLAMDESGLSRLARQSGQDTKRGEEEEVEDKNKQNKKDEHRDSRTTCLVCAVSCRVVSWGAQRQDGRNTCTRTRLYPIPIYPSLQCSTGIHTSRQGAWRRMRLLGVTRSRTLPITGGRPSRHGGGV